MDLRRHIILLTSDPQLAPRVGATLGMTNALMSETTCRSLAELGARIEKNPTSVVLMDIDSHPAQMLASLDQMTRRFSEARFIVLSDNMKGELVLDAMRAGARQFVLKTAIATDLAPALERIAPPDAARAGARGTVITVLSASGGCGATTLAVNLAHELHLVTSQRSLLVDMDIDYGAVGAYLGLQSQYGLADILTHRSHIDPELVRSTALSYSDGLHVLLSPAAAGLSQWELPVDDRIGQTIEAVRQAYAYTVVDAPRISLDLAVRLAHSSLFVLIVFQLGVKDIHIARAMHSALSASGVPSGQLVLVANRYRSRHAMVDIDDARRAFGGFSPVCVQNDFKNVIWSINYGKPLSEIARRSAARQDIAMIAQKIVKAGAGETLATASG
ncbi:MAG TPA: cellulose synthase operon protein YhjQ/BcsQ [Phycisphaerae bacterium]|nr:MinD/ParA family protein [Phycisphaerae bacterium]HOB74704.1 cellulose synthase operon protein YhjQ/BcsQ [Phycisphaerae bacterium]HOJ53592.1 cellulose synthase operon protein YhjQ/BcsQ [Phycisphaerae bacterium]HOL25251.1 cellulose synthase operon protein YhjQ/BcsQ [Phycisphaerae bacterium]HPU32252.1 cellulose synthase operon protein YhjQ/BcsQ [Phycisphaerae bacterium]